MKAFLVSTIFSIACCCVSMRAEVSPAALDAMNEFAEKQAAVLSKLESFDMSGTIKIVTSAEYAKATKSFAPLTSQLRFRIIAGPTDIKETVESLDEAGKVIRTEVYFLSPKRVVWVDDFNGFSVKPFALGESEGLFNFCPAFFENSFLNLSISFAGIPAIMISDLGSKEKWTKAVRSMQDASIGSDDNLYVTLGNAEGYSKIELARQLPIRGDYQVKSISFFTNGTFLKRKISVLSFSKSEELGSIGKKFKVDVYGLSSDAPSVTWEYTITDMKLNCPVDGDALLFEAGPVTNIYEAEKGCYVTATK